MREFGFVRVSAATLKVNVGNPVANCEEIVKTLGCLPVSDIVVFPELCITGYTIADLVHQQILLDTAKKEAELLATRIPDNFGMVVVGLPFQVNNALYNCAAVLSGGKVVGLYPKEHLPTYGEFYEGRWYKAGDGNEPKEVQFDSYKVPFGIDLLFKSGKIIMGIEICESLWTPCPPSSHMALSGANIIVNPSASNELVGKHSYRKSLVIGQSGRLISGYIYSGAGPTESTTDVVFGGSLLIAENGSLLKEHRQVGYGKVIRENAAITADIDIEKLMSERRKTTSFSRPTIAAAYHLPYRIIDGLIGDVHAIEANTLYRTVDAMPFVPNNESELAARCAEIFDIQVAALAKRMETAKPKTLNIGVSGGLDSTLALLVAVKACDLMGYERTRIHGITMPGFGTTDKTKDNAWQLMLDLGVSRDEIDISKLAMDTFKELNHKPFGIDLLNPLEANNLDWFKQKLVEIPNDKRHDLVFENVQARLRTFLLMSRGFVLGTGDMSELALGWATYNGDHMSMYNVNCSIPKTLVRFLVRWVAKNEFGHTDTGDLLEAIADTVISPELLPVGPNGELQATEDVVGPYELHDFFLFHTVRNGFSPRKILFLAEHTNSTTRFKEAYGMDVVEKWLKVFYKRFFSQQFKRSCVPDGPKVGSVSLSPRGDWRMPSDADCSLWVEGIDK